MKRWAIFIDVEGTSKIYETQKSRFFHAFERMFVSICGIGDVLFPESPDRLFVHQVGGDGVVIVSEFEEGLLETPISIAVVLMQVLLVNGIVSKGGISEDDFGNVQGYFPDLRERPKAAALYETLLAKDPRNFQARFSLARIYQQRLIDMPNALRQYRKLIDLLPPEHPYRREAQDVIKNSASVGKATRKGCTS